MTDPIEQARRRQRRREDPGWELHVDEETAKQLMGPPGALRDVSDEESEHLTCPRHGARLTERRELGEWACLVCMAIRADRAERKGGDE